MRTNSVGGEVALDFIFWPYSRHRFGWFLEPGLNDYSFVHGHERSVGLSGGLLIGVRRLAFCDADPNFLQGIGV